MRTVALQKSRALMPAATLHKVKEAGPKRTKSMWFCLHEKSGRDKSTDREQMGRARGWRRENGELVFHGDRVLVCGDKNSLEKDV